MSDFVTFLITYFQFNPSCSEGRHSRLFTVKIAGEGLWLSTILFFFPSTQTSISERGCILKPLSPLKSLSMKARNERRRNMLCLRKTIFTSSDRLGWLFFRQRICKTKTFITTLPTVFRQAYLKMSRGKQLQNPVTIIRFFSVSC